MTAGDPVADFRFYDEAALLRGDDLDLDSATAESGVVGATSRARAGAERRRRFGKLAFAILIGAVVGLAVVSGGRVLVHTVSRLGSPETDVAGRRAGAAGVPQAPQAVSAMEANSPRRNAEKGGPRTSARPVRPRRQLGRAPQGAPSGATPVAAGGRPPGPAEFGFER